MDTTTIELNENPRHVLLKNLIFRLSAALLMLCVLGFFGGCDYTNSHLNASRQADERALQRKIEAEERAHERRLENSIKIAQMRNANELEIARILAKLNLEHQNKVAELRHQLAVLQEKNRKDLAQARIDSVRELTPYGLISALLGALYFIWARMTSGLRMREIDKEEEIKKSEMVLQHRIEAIKTVPEEKRPALIKYSIDQNVMNQKDALQLLEADS